MPVRSRSRASSWTRNSPAFDRRARSSSRSASNPAAITPPSRTIAAGSSAIARARRSRTPAGGARAAESSARRSASTPTTSRCSSGMRASESRSPDRSRGRAVLSAIRPAMRSTSATSRNAAWTARYGPPPDSPESASTAPWRALTMARSRSGWCSQWPRRRLPIPVAHTSTRLMSVGAGVPRSVTVSSRLRRVAAFIRRYSPSRSGTRATT